MVTIGDHGRESTVGSSAKDHGVTERGNMAYSRGVVYRVLTLTRVLKRRW